jgi:hypothetical protein
MLLFIFSFLCSIFASLSGSEYYKQIDPVDLQGYTAISGEHALTFLAYNILYLLSIIAVCVKGRNLPPLALSLGIIFITIGIAINGVTVVQYFDTENCSWRDGGDGVIWAFCHIMNIIFSIVILAVVIIQERKLAQCRQYKNKFLNKMNAIIGKHCFLWAFILLIPVFTIITLILILFGQEHDSLIKVWTETTTWTFSQREHPPYLEHKGHYLCTVAACGHPRIVKPLRLGKRHGNTIIVNRQLMIANAYEDMLKRHFGKLHGIIRFIYDKYGYPISKYITNKYASDAIYILMKPLELFFLINLYLFEPKPECLINKQYE